jgi:hypothetical protein
MTSYSSDDERDERIRNEVIVDTYTPDEQAISWCYYLERRLPFPFQARCIEKRAISPLEEDEVVRVVGMIDEVISEMFVEIEWMDRTFGVPLAQLEPIDPDEDTREAINDWHYWEGDGTRIQ